MDTQVSLSDQERAHVFDKSIVPCRIVFKYGPEFKYSEKM